MIYFAKITKQSHECFLVEFPELDGCFTEGKSIEEALKHAKVALDVWLESHCDREINIPEPENRRGQTYHAIEVDLQLSFAIMLRKLRKKKRLTQALMAQRIGISQQAYAKLEIPSKSNPSLKTVDKISKALGIQLTFNLAA